MDRRSNRCPQCHHAYTSVTHQKKCMGRSGKAVKRRRRSGTTTFARTSASEVLGRETADRIVANASYYEDKKPDEQVE